MSSEANQNTSDQTSSTGDGAAQAAPVSAPLEELSPAALDELFSRDPEKLSEDDIEAIRLSYRKQFGEFRDAQTAKKKGPGARKVKKERPEGGLTLDMLDLPIPGSKK